jgi:SAM-dependent methyltransferase
VAEVPGSNPGAPIAGTEQPRGYASAMSDSERLPYPPLNLANRVLCLDGWGDPIAAYEGHGAEARQALLDLLPEDWSFEGKRVLDFGCGAGRTLRHFIGEAQDGAEFWGADIDGPSVEWLRGNLSPPLHPVQSSVDPPLGLEHSSFDLVWAVSVFTHLADNSLPWLVELHRLLKPGGHLIATYMGRYTSETFTDEPWDEDRIGMNVLRRGQGWENGGPMVLMSDWWVKAHWGRAFDIVRQAPVQGQTWTLLCKRDVEVSVADLERPADDPREYAALRHNLRQIEWDHQRQLEEVRAHERSLRTVARRLRQRIG